MTSLDELWEESRKAQEEFVDGFADLMHQAVLLNGGSAEVADEVRAEGERLAEKYRESK